MSVTKEKTDLLAPTAAGKGAKLLPLAMGEGVGE
jgi:hypothetical protein